MADDLEYVITGALLECSEGTVPMPFQATPRNVRIQGLKVGNASDKTPYLNIPSFVICKKLSQMAGGTPVPCVPAPIMWQDTYPVQVNKQEVLIFKSCIRCSSGQGKITFLTSGQTPVSPEASQQLEEMQKEAEEALKAAEAEKNSVGEAGFAEGLIPVWGSGRDMIHAIQTGDTLGAVVNGGFLALDVVGVVAGIFSFGTATAAEMGLKTGLKAAFEAGTKVVAKGAARQLAELTAKSLAMKKGLLKGLTKLASTRVCVLACFPAGTSVAVEEGYRNIEDLEAGDHVWSRDEETGKLALQPVVSTMSRETDHLINLRLGGERIQTTAEHPFYSRQARGWQRAGTLAVGDEVIRSDGQWVAVSAVEHRTEFEQPVIVYNIEVANAHTYFVGKWMWWVHNANVCVSKIVKEGAEKVTEITLKLRGEAVKLKNFRFEKDFNYVKRATDELADLRKSFNKVRSDFMKDMANNPAMVTRLKKMGVSDAEITRMKNGGVPDGFQVHHKKPLDDGGTNDFDNLVLIENEPYHKAVTGYQKTNVGKLEPGQSKTVDWPMIDDSLYPNF